MNHHLRYVFVAPCILLIISGSVAGDFTIPIPIAGLKCYECNSEDPGCDNNVNTTGTKYVKDCDARAVGCISWIIHYEFVFSPFITRSCAYGYKGNPGGEEEQYCLVGTNSKKFYKGADKRFSKGYQTYNQVVECLRKNRVNAGLPLPAPLAKNAPDEHGMAGYNAKPTSLGNVENVDGNMFQWEVLQSYGEKFWKYNPPNESDLHCYSCDEDVSIKGFGNVGLFQEKNKIQGPLPQCEVTKRIPCPKSYGCATLWEIRKEPKGLSSRIWRGCWHPGDQLCLRRPSSKYGDKGYSAEARNSNNGRSFNKNCNEAYAQSRATRRGTYNNFTIQWAGTIVKETEALYNEYVQCRQDVRKKLGQEQLKNYSRNVHNLTEKPEGEDFFAGVRYIFCGFTEGCNLKENEDDPWKAPPEPPGPEEPGPEIGLGKCSTWEREKQNSASKSHLYPILCFFLAMFSFNL